MCVHQIWEISRGPQGGSLCQKTAKSDEGILCNWGSKKNFSGGPTPKPEVNLLEMAGGICRARGDVSDGEKFLKNSQGLARYLGSKKNLWRHLAAKLELFRWKWKGEWVEGIEVYNLLKYGVRRFSRTRDMVHRSFHDFP